ncbi:Oligopeptide transporter 2 [Cladobotryum mycophilum]|uniref:Oligopeptide transporter 2 n=1 Tax=Cladobotryum mycophilum TaxID=491253 RepID=A0ABR0S6L7_9HYPO
MSQGVEEYTSQRSTDITLGEKMAHDIASETVRPKTSQEEQAERRLHVTDDDLLEAKELAGTYTLEEVRNILSAFYQLHKKDPLIPLDVIETVGEFLGNEDIFQQPEKFETLIWEMKIQAALTISNSPYAEVRSVVSNKDDPSLPCSTIRAWVIGIVLSGAISFVNVFFEIRLPPVFVGANVVQLLAYPLGKLAEKTLPDIGLTVFGIRHSLNPGTFNKKEHMLITLMASVSKSVPYSHFLIWMQYLPQFFNQHWAINFGYQFMVTLSTNFIGYSLAGVCRRFLVYPSYCLWPSSLVTIALNSALHGEGNAPVLGPFGRTWHMSRYKFFFIAFTAMFCYFWLPGYVFTALSTFNWMTWIAPNNRNLVAITGSISGLGLNPIPTLDWNILASIADPLMLPYFTTLNLFSGCFFTMFIVIGFYYSNAFSTAYLPINSNQPFDHFAKPYNVSSILDHRGILDEQKYQAYSPPYLSAGAIVINLCYFSTYTAALTHGFLHHRHEIWMGSKDLINSFRPSKRNEGARAQHLDVHSRLMKEYREVPEWWYIVILIISIAIGCVALAHWPTYTSPAVVVYGLILAVIFIVPTGIIYAMTGIEVTLAVLAQFIGGSFVPGNALAMSFFKTYGFVTAAQALSFSNDQKLAHYAKIPPRLTFFAQMVPTLISTFVSVGVVTYQVHIKDVCTATAPFRFLCPQETTFYTSGILWGTVGPKRLWGVGGQYAVTLIGFPLGIVVVLGFWYLARLFPESQFLRSVHPVMILTGGVLWAPFNLTYIWPSVPVATLSWLYIKPRFLALWSKYNFVLSAAFSAGVAISAIIQFFSLSYNNVALAWWGNTVSFEGCEILSCVLKTLAPGEFFGPKPGTYN